MNSFVKSYIILKPHRTPEEARAKYKKYIERNQLWFIVETFPSHVPFVVIRDKKHIHNTNPHYLVLPRRRIVGLEDPDMNSVRDIFKFAWNVPTPDILNRQKCLIVNPKQFRSQDQLHVHIVRKSCTPERNVSTSSSLDNVLDFVKPGEGILIWHDGTNFCIATENKFSFEMKCIDGQS